MEKNRGARYKCTQLLLPDFFYRIQKQIDKQNQQQQKKLTNTTRWKNIEGNTISSKFDGENLYLHKWS